MDIQIWSDQRQKCSYNPCSIHNGGCSHICAVAPGNRTECKCPYGQRLRLTNNERTCSTMTASRRCNSTQFTCSNGQCIAKRYACDTIRHCADGSDENANYCAFHACLPSEFKCANGRCVHALERCDRVDQCGDASDESNCVYPQCDTNTEFQCGNFKCISAASRCNGVVDCDDGKATDEIACPQRNCTSSSVYDIKCPNTNVCIMRKWLCDGDNDCGDSADENELFCKSVQCPAGFFKCKNETHKCIPYNWIWYFFNAQHCFSCCFLHVSMYL